MLQNYYTTTFTVKRATQTVSATKTVKKEYVISEEYKGALVHMNQQLQFTNEKETVYADYKIYCSSDVVAYPGDYIMVGNQSYLVRNVDPGLKPHHKEIACTYLM